MASIDRVLAALERSIKVLADDLANEHGLTGEDHTRLLLAARMAQSVVSAYTAHELDQATLDALNVGTLVTGSNTPRTLNISLRRLVDNQLMTPWYARFLNSTLQMKRTVIISGNAKVGKSTLLNALVDLLPTDHRVVSIEEDAENLPVLQQRSFTVQLKAQRGTAAHTAAFRKAADMRPTWVVAGELARHDGPSFLDALAPGVTGGLTTVESPEPEDILNEWLAQGAEVAEQLKTLNPLVVHLVREDGEQPRVERVLEVTTDRGNLVVTPRMQVETERVGVTGGERSPLARSEQEAGISGS